MLIEEFPKNVEEAEYILDKYNETGDLELKRYLWPMKMFAVSRCYFKGAGKAHCEFYREGDEYKVYVSLDTTHLYACPDAEVFVMTLKELFDEDYKPSRLGLG